MVSSRRQEFYDRMCVFSHTRGFNGCFFCFACVCGLRTHSSQQMTRNSESYFLMHLISLVCSKSQGIIKCEVHIVTGPKALQLDQVKTGYKILGKEILKNTNNII